MFGIFKSQVTFFALWQTADYQDRLEQLIREHKFNHDELEAYTGNIEVTASTDEEGRKLALDAIEDHGRVLGVPLVLINLHKTGKKGGRCQWIEVPC